MLDWDMAMMFGIHNRWHCCEPVNPGGYDWPRKTGPNHADPDTDLTEASFDLLPPSCGSRHQSSFETSERNAIHSRGKEGLFPPSRIICILSI